MIIRNKDQKVIEVEMFHIVNLGKDGAFTNFEHYLNELRKEFQQEFTKHLYQIPVNPASSHIILP